MGEPNKAAKLIFGCGYLGRRVAKRWLDAGNRVFAVTRSEARAAEFREMGLLPLIADVTEPASLAELAEKADLSDVDTVLFAVGFDRSVGRPIHEVYVDGLQSVLGLLPDSIERFIYISSTGVFGQTDGQWIDEQSVCQPTREGGKACLAAEGVLMASRFSRRAIILRLAGIYGPDRVPRKADLISNKSFPTEGHLNLIHVDDAAMTVLAAEQAAPLPSLYLVSDETPVLRADYYAELRRLLGVTDVADAVNASQSSKSKAAATIETSSRKERARADKRIRSDLFRSELKISLAYPNYRVGLAAILTDG